MQQIGAKPGNESIHARAIQVVTTFFIQNWSTQNRHASASDIQYARDVTLHTSTCPTVGASRHDQQGMFHVLTLCYLCLF